MAKQIYLVGTFKGVLTGTELVEIQEAGGGFGSSKRTSVQAIANLVAVPPAPVQSVQGRYGDVVLVKADIGLSNVDNTSDLNKPISTATQNALSLKANISGQNFTGPIDAPTITQAGVTIVTVGNFNANFDARLATVLSSTTQLPEGTNLYYTDSRVDARINLLRTNTDELPEGAINKYFTGLNLYNQIAVSTGVYKAYDSGTGIVSIFGGGTPAEPAVVMVNGLQGIVVLNSDDIDEGASNLYFTDTRADTRADLRIKESNKVNVIPVAAGIATIDCSLGNYFTLTLTGNVTINITNPPAVGYGQTIYIEFLQDATGGRTITLPASFKATDGSDTQVGVVANSYSVLAASTMNNGTRWSYTMQGDA